MMQPAATNANLSRRSFATALLAGGAGAAGLAAIGSLSACSGSDDSKIREENLACLEEWFAHTGKDRLEPRMACWNQGDDVAFEVPFYFGGEGLAVKGYEAVLEQERLNVEHYSTWVFNRVETYETANPNEFWYRIKGEGTLSAGGGNTPITLDPMLLFFRMKDGKIQVWEEYFNPLSIYAQSGIELPEMY